jgi:hypothetical protein
MCITNQMAYNKVLMLSCLGFSEPIGMHFVVDCEKLACLGDQCWQLTHVQLGIFFAF